MKQHNTAAKLGTGILTIVLLTLCLLITTFALVYTEVAIEQNRFQMGTVAINLNDGEPIIRGEETLFEPGMTVKRSFFVKNEGTGDLYYKLYFPKAEGSLADLLQIKICRGDRILYEGTARTLTRDAVTVTDEALSAGEQRELSIWFHFPEDITQSALPHSLAFDFAVDAVQAKNNPDMRFD